MQGTAEGEPSRAREMDALLALADKGIRELLAAQTRGVGSGVMRLVLASNNAKKLAELQALFARLPVELVAQGALRHRRGRRAARHLRRERAGQGAPRGAAAAAAPPSPTTRACASTRWAARRAWCRRTMRRQFAATADREQRRAAQDAANNALLLQRLHGVTDRRARFVSTLVAVRHAAGSRAADRDRPLGRPSCCTRRAAAAASATTR